MSKRYVLCPSCTAVIGEISKTPINKYVGCDENKGDDAMILFTNNFLPFDFSDGYCSCCDAYLRVLRDSGDVIVTEIKKFFA